jgi:hypothetical protein
MRNQLGGLSLCSIALLVGAGACAKASFAPATIADGGGGTDGPAAAADSGVEPDVGEFEVGESCSEPNLPCSDAPATGICHPICQRGGCNWCNEKCSYVFDGTVAQPTCVSNTGQGVFPASCKYSKQSDNCAQGSICLPPALGDITPYCFQLCILAADCLGEVACGQRDFSSLGVSIGVCDPPYDSCGGTCCDPLDPLGGIGCSAPRGVCLLVSPDQRSQHSRTVCEFDQGGQKPGQSCSASRDCLPKTTCVNNICRQVCNTANLCASGATCTWWGAEWGYCPN